MDSSFFGGWVGGDMDSSSDPTHPPPGGVGGCPGQTIPTHPGGGGGGVRLIPHPPTPWGGGGRGAGGY